jgi:hypothetical protein
MPRYLHPFKKLGFRVYFLGFRHVRRMVVQGLTVQGFRTAPSSRQYVIDQSPQIKNVKRRKGNGLGFSV